MSINYTDDPISMLIAVCAAANLGDDLDRKTIKEITEKSWNICGAASEEISAELDRLLIGGNPEEGLQLLADTELLRYIIPELWLQIGYDQDSPYHSLTLWEHTKRVVGLSLCEPETRWASLLHDIGKPFAKKKNSKGHSSFFMHDKIGAEMARGIAFRLGWTPGRTERVLYLIGTHMDDDSPLRQADNCAKKG